MLILDTDAASVLAKGGLLEETVELFENHSAAITPKIEEELEKPLDHGYSYPHEIFDNIETEKLDREEKEQYRKLSEEHSIDEGEAEAIVVAENRDAIFFTMDRAAARFARKQSVQTLAFNNLAKMLLEKQLVSREELEDSISRIEKKDKRKIDKDDILQ